ncbi:hypothetical protein MUP77_15080 [Candidatus Bathyarchaeota archaeon]|nr:hypothetical protein [Candidatus Bathyarchaeota archaeon]
MEKGGIIWTFGAEGIYGARLLTCEEGVERLKKQLEAHYLRELELITEILSLDDKNKAAKARWG